MNFFFDYIYYRLTQLFVKRDGLRGFTGICLMSIAQGVFAAVAVLEISKLIWSADVRALHAKQFGYFGAAIGLVLMYYNYKRYNGKYLDYYLHWKDESQKKRYLKGTLVLLILLFPFILEAIFGVHWKK